MPLTLNFSALLTMLRSRGGMSVEYSDLLYAVKHSNEGAGCRREVTDFKSARLGSLLSYNP